MAGGVTQDKQSLSRARESKENFDENKCLSARNFSQAWMRESGPGVSVCLPRMARGARLPVLVLLHSLGPEIGKCCYLGTYLSRHL